MEQKPGPLIDEETKRKIEELEKQVQKIKEELKKDAKKNCKKCNGEGHLGVNKDTFIVQTCSCVFKNREKARLAAPPKPKSESKLETIKVNESKIETVKVE